MITRDRILTLAKRRIDVRRFCAEEQCDNILYRLRKNNDWLTCESNLRQAQVDYIMCDGERKQQAKVAIDKYSARQKQLLEVWGIKESDLKPRYSCKLCNDTGYLDNKICACLQNEIYCLIAEHSSIYYENFTFANSTETDIYNVDVYKKAKEAVFACKNIFLTGMTGTGKTYLLSACANLSIELHNSVMFITAYELNSMFLEAYFSDFATKQAIIDSLIDVDVLAVDDLGTENIYKNVSAELLFTIVNERINKRKQLYISTNLTLKQFRDRYDERIFSRLLAQNDTFSAELKGRDKRLFI